MIAKDCLANRQRRIDTDLVQDNTEKKLLQELEIISGIKATLTEALNNARDQLTASREAKHNLEMDWSDKVMHFVSIPGLNYLLTNLGKLFITIFLS